MFLASIFFIHIGLSMRKISMMGRTQIGAEVIIIGKNRYYASQNKKFPNNDDCEVDVTHIIVSGIKKRDTKVTAN